MPQLRDSGTTGVHTGLHAGEAHARGHSRIFGVETEYGVAATGCDAPIAAGQLAMAMFRPVMTATRSTNSYLSNGARLYVDVGSHPEYATAEATDPFDALVQDLAGERVMRRLALDAQDDLRGAHGGGLRIHVFKNNVDSAGHSFGCHENYLLRRWVPLESVERELIPFLVSRVLFTGAGRYTGEDGVEDGFELTQRADFLDDAVSSATTRARPMVNTRDEPHADSDLFRRLHVIVGDSNRSQTATWMKMATTHLVLCMIEDAAAARGRSGADAPVPGFGGMALADPGAAIRTISRDRTGRAPVSLADGGRTCALDIQRRYWEAARSYVDAHRGDADVDGPRTDEALRLWGEALDALAGGAWERLADWVDWAAKLRLIRALIARAGRSGAAVSENRLRQIDMDYHDVANGSVYDRLVSAGRMRVLVDDAAIDRAVSTPPADTRAALRGRFVEAALHGTSRWSADWTHVSVLSPRRCEAELLDPFGCEPSDAYRAALAALA